MSIIADLRASGLRFSLRPDGTVGASGFSPQNERLKPSLSIHKPEILRALKYEERFGVPFEHSSIYCHLSRLFDCWLSSTDCEERTRALGLLSRWNNALTDDLKSGCALVVREQPLLEVLSHNRVLEGAELRAVVSSIVKAPTVDLGALGAPSPGPAVATVDLGVLG